MLLMRSISAHMRQSDRRLAPAQVGILARIGEQPCTLSELAQHQAVRLPTISRSISMLADRGLVERWTPEHNRRQTIVHLTAAGRDALAGIKREAERHVDSVLAELSDGERAKVHVAIDILRRELDASMPMSRVAPPGARAAAQSAAGSAAAKSAASKTAGTKGVAPKSAGTKGAAPKSSGTKGASAKGAPAKGAPAKGVAPRSAAARSRA
jgi:DNA-binding MarR family transcriptional regulator